MFLRQSTSQVIRFGPCLDKTNGVTEETALTLAQADMRLSKDGGAFAQKNTTGNATHDSDGWYSTTLDTTDTVTVGELILNVHQPANMLPVWMRFFVVEEAVYDALYAASAAGPLQSTTAGRKLDVTATGAAGIDWANVENPTTALDLSGTDIQLADTVTTLTNLPSITANWLTAAGINAGALDGKGNWNIGKTGYALTTANWNVGKTGYSLTATTGLGAQTANITGSLSGSVGSVTGNVDGDVTGSVGSNLELGPAEVNAEVDNALNVTTYAEPVQGAPTATTTIQDKIGWLYKAFRNRSTQTSSTWSLYNDDTTTVDAKAAVSDNGTTADKKEVVTGP